LGLLDLALWPLSPLAALAVLALLALLCVRGHDEKQNDGRGQYRTY